MTTAIAAIHGKGRYWLRRHKWGGWHVIDSSQTRPVSRLLGNFSSPLSAWNFVKGLYQ